MKRTPATATAAATIAAPVAQPPASRHVVVAAAASKARSQAPTTTATSARRPNPVPVHTTSARKTGPSSSPATAAHSSASTTAAAAAARPTYTTSVLVVAPAAELVALFQNALDELAPPAPRTSIADRKHFGVPKSTAASAVDDRRVAAAVYTLLGPGAALCNARARTAFHLPASAPPYLAQLLANTRDLLQIDDNEVHKIYESIAGVVRFGVGVTPAGELALLTQTPRALLTRMLETRALMNQETQFELADNQLLIDMAVAAVQQCCAAYVHARTHARAQNDVVVAHLHTRVSSVIDWSAKLHEAELARRVSSLPDGTVAVL